MLTPKGEINEEIFNLCVKTDFMEKEIVEAGLRTPEDCYEALKRHLPDISFEEFTSSMQVLHSLVTEAQEGALTDEDLDEVAGGSDVTGLVALGITGGIVLTGAGIAAAFAL